MMAMWSAGALTRRPKRRRSSSQGSKKSAGVDPAGCALGADALDAGFLHHARERAEVRAVDVVDVRIEGEGGLLAGEWGHWMCAWVCHGGASRITGRPADIAGPGSGPPIVRDACSVGIRLARESLTPLGQVRDTTAPQYSRVLMFSSCAHHARHAPMAVEEDDRADSTTSPERSMACQSLLRARRRAGARPPRRTCPPPPDCTGIADGPPGIGSWPSATDRNRSRPPDWSSSVRCRIPIRRQWSSTVPPDSDRFRPGPWRPGSWRLSPKQRPQSPWDPRSAYRRPGCGAAGRFAGSVQPLPGAMRTARRQVSDSRGRRHFVHITLWHPVNVKLEGPEEGGNFEDSRYPQ